MSLVQEARDTWLKIKPVEDLDEYNEDTNYIKAAVEYLIDQNPEDVLNRLLKAKAEVDAGKYRKK
jgi:hypothetical protein